MNRMREIPDTVILQSQRAHLAPQVAADGVVMTVPPVAMKILGMMIMSNQLSQTM